MLSRAGPAIGGRHARGAAHLERRPVDRWSWSSPPSSSRWCARSACCTSASRRPARWSGARGRASARRRRGSTLTDWSGRPLTHRRRGRRAARARCSSSSRRPARCARRCSASSTRWCAASSGWLRLVLASDGPREEHEAFVRAHGLAERAVRAVARARHGLSGRQAAVRGADRRARACCARKGLVNTREHLESLFEAMERGVGSVQEYLQREAGSRHVA